MYRDVCFGYEIRQWNGRHVMVWGSICFIFLIQVIRLFVIMLHIVSRFESMGYVREVVSLPYDT
jgi:hypothetical protein